jgi:hypothetical protein
MTKREIVSGMERNTEGAWVLFVPGHVPAFLRAYGYTKREAVNIFYDQLSR